MEQYTVSMKRPQISGVYAIYSECNGRRYIGSSINVNKRLQQHKKFLRAGSHFNPYLQNAWNKYGEEAFEFIILEECEPEMCLEREQWWFEQFENKYNLCEVAGSTLGYRHTDEAKANMSAAAKGKTLTPEHREKIGAAQRGRKLSSEQINKMRIANTGKKHTPEARAKMSESRKGNQHALGHKHTEETRRVISEKGQGRVVSPETRTRMSEAARARWARRARKLEE